MDFLVYNFDLILNSCGLQRLLIVSSHMYLIGFGMGVLRCMYPIFVSSWSNISMLFRIGDPLLFMYWRMRCTNEWSPLANFVWAKFFLASLGCAVSDRLASEGHIRSGSFIEVVCDSKTWALAFGPLVTHSEVHHTWSTIVLTVGGMIYFVQSTLDKCYTYKH